MRGLRTIRRGQGFGPLATISRGILGETVPGIFTPFTPFTRALVVSNGSLGAVVLVPGLVVLPADSGLGCSADNSERRIEPWE